MTKKDIISKIQNDFASLYTKDDVIKILENLFEEISIKEIVDTLSKINIDLTFKNSVTVDKSSADFSFDDNFKVELNDVDIDIDCDKVAETLKQLFSTGEDLINDILSQKMFGRGDGITTLFEDIPVRNDKNRFDTSRSIPGFINKNVLLKLINEIPNESISRTLTDEQIEIIHSYLEQNVVYDERSMELYIDGNIIILESIPTYFNFDAAQLTTFFSNY